MDGFRGGMVVHLVKTFWSPDLGPLPPMHLQPASVSAIAVRSSTTISDHYQNLYAILSIQCPRSVQGTNVRKRIVTPTPTIVTTAEEGWLDPEHVATVEVTSEDKDFPIESALSLEPRLGWRAAQPGTQTIRLVFDEPQELKRISVVFEENEMVRTQEFVLRASPKPGGPFREIVRQQWNFSPPTSAREAEDYRVELSEIVTLELTIRPNISGGAACASLKSLRVSTKVLGELKQL